MIKPQGDAERLQECRDYFYRTVPRPAVCIHCGGSRIRWDGSSIRSASIRNEEATEHVPRIPQRRVDCGECGRSWILRPPGIVAHKHYQLCVVAAAVSDYLFEPKITQDQVAKKHGCSSRTLSRWLRWVGQVAVPAAIQARILDAAGEAILAPVRAVENLGRKARCAIRRVMLPAAAEVLCLFESLGLVLGLEPPGLRSVIVATLRNRSRIATYVRPLIPDFGKVTI